MRILSAILPVLLVVFFPAFMAGQNNQADHKVNIEIPEVALLGLVSGETSQVHLAVAGPSEAGSTVDFSNTGQNSSIWINYSSIIRSQNHRRKVVAAVQGEIPEGVRLVVEASEAAGNGKGKLGKPVGKVALSDEPTEIISDIGSSFTGKGAHNGHHLTYKLENDGAGENTADLSRLQTSLQVVYTLTDHN